jgi:shikimate kinase
MSGSGKTTLSKALQLRGYKSVDLDTEDYSMWVDAEPDPEYPDNEVKPGKDWVWNEDRVYQLFSIQSNELLFISGCASNMAKFYSYISVIVLLTAPARVLADRLASRQPGTYGSSPEQLARVLRLQQTIEPLLRRIAQLEVDTQAPDEVTVELLLNQVDKIISG